MSMDQCNAFKIILTNGGGCVGGIGGDLHT